MSLSRLQHVASAAEAHVPRGIASLEHVVDQVVRPVHLNVVVEDIQLLVVRSQQRLERVLVARLGAVERIAEIAKVRPSLEPRDHIGPDRNEIVRCSCSIARTIDVRADRCDEIGPVDASVMNRAVVAEIEIRVEGLDDEAEAAQRSHAHASVVADRERAEDVTERFRPAWYVEVAVDKVVFARHSNQTRVVQSVREVVFFGGSTCGGCCCCCRGCCCRRGCS